MDLVRSIYHEKQEPGSMLCAQHALNNLLQASLFTPQDLADIARQLDVLEAQQMDEVPGGGGVEESPNYDDSGFFSIMVLEEALKVLGLRLVRWQSKEMASQHDTPECMEGFVLNHQLHWFTIRRFATAERFYNLDSCIPQPAWISPTYLGMSLREAENSGYSIFAVLRAEDSIIAGLPDCAASDLAITLPPPSSSGQTDSRTAVTKSFAGLGNVLGSSSTSTSALASTSASAYSSKRRTSSEISSVEDESTTRSRRPRLVSPAPSSDPVANLARQSASPVPRDIMGLSEDDQLALAIADSLKAANLESQGQDDDESDDEVVIVEPVRSGKGKGKGAAGDLEKAQASSRRRGELEEEAEFEAALKASMQESNASAEVVQEEEEEEEDAPSVEEMRRKRLARFG